MNTFSMTCSCGDPFSVEATDLVEAKAKMKAMMTQEVVDKHMAEKHPGQSMTMAMVHAEVDQNLKPAV